jgi:signal transduction histidine kinase
MTLSVKQKTLLVLASAVTVTAVLQALLAWYLTTRLREQATFARLDRDLSRGDPRDRPRFQLIDAGISSEPDRMSTRRNMAPPITVILAASAGILIVSLLGGTLAIGRVLDPMVHEFDVLRRELAREFELRLDERVSERTRIARELHDTVLQSFHGVLYRFQAAKNLLPGRAAEARQVLVRGLDDAANAIAEGRDALHALRASTVVSNNLAEVLGALGGELARVHEDARPSPDVGINVEGHSRDLHPIVHYETYRVAAEALRNAFQHAQAQHIDVDIRYGGHHFQVLVRDDGRGIDPERLDAQPDGHWGLTGMRERAESIGGTLRVWSAVDAGTEIELTVPARRAYANPRSGAA